MRWFTMRDGTTCRDGLASGMGAWCTHSGAIVTPWIEWCRIRGVPEGVHDELVRLAGAEGVSLNRFVLAELERIARRHLNDAILHRASTRKGPRLSSASVVEAVRADRERADRTSHG